MPEEKAQTTESVGPPKKKKKWLLYVIILLVVIAGGAAAGYLIFPAQAKQILGQVYSPGKEPKPEIGIIVSLEPFLFNLTGSTSKYAKVSLGVEVRDAKVAEEAKKLMPAIRDKVLTVLGAKTLEMLMDVNERETMKKDIARNLRSLFGGENDLKAVYMTDVIIQ